MKRHVFKILILAFVILIQLLTIQISFSQGIKKDNINCKKYLSGIKTLVLVTSPEYKEFIKKGEVNYSMFLQQIINNTTKSYFLNLNYDIYFDYNINISMQESLCDIGYLLVGFNFNSATLSNFSLTILDCNNDYFQYLDKRSISMDLLNLTIDQKEGIIRNEIDLIFGKPYYIYNVNEKLKLKGETTNWTLSKIQTKLDSDEINQFEGIYEIVNNKQFEAKYKIGIINNNGYFNIIYLAGAINKDDWKEGDLKGQFIETADSKILRGTWFMANKIANQNAYLECDGSFIKLIIEGEESLYLKLYPTNTNKNSESVTGTGFALTSSGFFATNYHVVEGATKITVRGVNGNYIQKFDASIVIFDKNNDLAILKVNTENTSCFENIPYAIKNEIRQVGESVFVLGYPLMATMGEEIKLTSGIISSKSGYDGNVTTYQVTAPIQPGNSGSPMFDKNGNIIGIINAKHLGAENVSYAIKSSYLINLCNELELKLPQSNTLAGKSLVEIVDKINNFVLILEVN